MADPTANFAPDFERLVSNLSEVVKNFNFITVLWIAAYMAIGITITFFLSRLVGSFSEKHISAHHSQLLRRITFYVGLIFSFILPFKATGIDVTGILGAAGILAGIFTAAVAFASQTSISNFLSGMFLLAEKPFVVGDYVTVDDILGEVLSIDLLSVRIRTKDNTLVRIPNEVLMKSKFCNMTRFPIRRVDVKLRLKFSEDLDKVKNILIETTKKNPQCLVSPPPELTFLEFGDAGVLLQFSVWTTQENFNSLQTSIQMEIYAALIVHNIEIPTANTPVIVTS